MTFNGRAAVDCHRAECPSDTADWEPLMGIDQEKAEAVMVGDKFTCALCGLVWMHTPEAGDYVPEPGYWK